MKYNINDDAIKNETLSRFLLNIRMNQKDELLARTYVDEYKLRKIAMQPPFNYYDETKIHNKLNGVYVLNDLLLHIFATLTPTYLTLKYDSVVKYSSAKLLYNSRNPETLTIPKLKKKLGGLLPILVNIENVPKSDITSTRAALTRRYDEFIRSVMSENTTIEEKQSTFKTSVIVIILLKTAILEDALNYINIIKPMLTGNNRNAYNELIAANIEEQLVSLAAPAAPNVVEPIGAEESNESNAEDEQHVPAVSSSQSEFAGTGIPLPARPLRQAPRAPGTGTQIQNNIILSPEESAAFGNNLEITPSEPISFAPNNIGPTNSRLAKLLRQEEAGTYLIAGAPHSSLLKRAAIFNEFLSWLYAQPNVSVNRTTLENEYDKSAIYVRTVNGVQGEIENKSASLIALLNDEPSVKAVLNMDYFTPSDVNTVFTGLINAYTRSAKSVNINKVIRATHALKSLLKQFAAVIMNEYDRVPQLEEVDDNNESENNDNSEIIQQPATGTTLGPLPTGIPGQRPQPQLINPENESTLAGLLGRDAEPTSTQQSISSTGTSLPPIPGAAPRMPPLGSKQTALKLRMGLNKIPEETLRNVMFERGGLNALSVKPEDAIKLPVQPTVTDNSIAAIPASISENPPSPPTIEAPAGNIQNLIAVLNAIGNPIADRTIVPPPPIPGTSQAPGAPAPPPPPPGPGSLTISQTPINMDNLVAALSAIGSPTPVAPAPSASVPAPLPAAVVPTVAPPPTNTGNLVAALSAMSTPAPAAPAPVQQEPPTATPSGELGVGNLAAILSSIPGNQAPGAPPPSPPPPSPPPPPPPPGDGGGGDGGGAPGA